MLTMDQIHHIRELYYEQGIENISELAKMTGYSWNTVKKYIDKEDFNSPPPKTDTASHSSKLDPYKSVIYGWLEADKKAPRKQRHTAKRVYRRLRSEIPDFDCSYRLVAIYVASVKSELRLTAKNEAYIPLLHRPGEAQADFGQADFFEHGKRITGKYVVLSFPYSNGGYIQLGYGENLECLLEALQRIFEYMNGVPREIWFDNASAIVNNVIRGGSRKLNERFVRFCEHYRFKPVFMNLESGWEKGNVENKVGYSRRNYLVPIPEFDDLSGYNVELLKTCDSDMEREHYKNGQFISELFTEDSGSLTPLPSIPFDTARYELLKTDKYGKCQLDGKYIYSASPSVKECNVTLRITSSTVAIFDDRGKEIASHRRLYGEDRESMDWIPYLRYIAGKPRSLRNSGIYEMMPQRMQIYLDNCSNSDRGSVLKTLAELTDRDGFESALFTVDQALDYSATDPDSLLSLHNRLFSELPELPRMDTAADEMLGKIIPFCSSDLSSLDKVLMRGGEHHG